MLCFHAGSDPAAQKQLENHGKDNSVHSNINATPAGCTAKGTLSFADKPLVLPGQMYQSHPNFLTFHLSILKEISLMDE